MSYTQPKTIQELIAYIKSVRQDVLSGALSSSDGGARIVGATYGNTIIDLDALIEQHPKLEVLVELCADLEIQSPNYAAMHTEEDWSRVQHLVEVIEQTPSQH